MQLDSVQMADRSGSQASVPPPAEDGGLGGKGDGQLDIKARSANIYGDPKLKELKHYTRSHQHETRLRESAELEKRAPSAGRSRSNLRSEGCEMMDEKLKKLSKDEAVVPYIAKTGELPESFRQDRPPSKDELQGSMEERLAMLRRMDGFRTRLAWREGMDHSLRRLLVDLELSRDERLKEYQLKPKKGDSMMDQSPIEEEIQKTRFAKARCEHLDKIYGWYEIHGQKEARKERKAPPYLRYNPQHPVMPGSMRVAPPLRELGGFGGKFGMGHSSSSPALLAAGSAATGASMASAAAAAAAAPPPVSEPAGAETR